MGLAKEMRNLDADAQLKAAASDADLGEAVVLLRIWMPRIGVSVVFLAMLQFIALVFAIVFGVTSGILGV